MGKEELERIKKNFEREKAEFLEGLEKVKKEVAQFHEQQMEEIKKLREEIDFLFFQLNSREIKDGGDGKASRGD